MRNFRKDPICDKCGWACIETVYRPAVDIEAARKEMEIQAAQKRMGFFFDPVEMSCSGWPKEHLDRMCLRCGNRWQERPMTEAA